MPTAVLFRFKECARKEQETRGASRDMGLSAMSSRLLLRKSIDSKLADEAAVAFGFRGL